MKLTNLFFGEQQPITETNSTSSDFSVSFRLARMLREMVPGQTLQGEIVSKNGNEVQIKLLDDLLFSARLEQNMNLALGQRMSFEVKNSGKQIVLSPLFANTATDMNAMKALDMAGLPISERGLELTGRMMEAGLSIDRNSLQQAFRELESNTRADVLDIVDLHKLGLEVNDTNLEQISNYRHMNHQMILGVTELTVWLPEVLDNLAEGEDNLSEQFIKGFISLFEQSEESLSSQEKPQILNGETNENLPITEETKEEALQNSAQAQAESSSKGADSPEPTSVRSDFQNLSQLKQYLDELPRESRLVEMQKLLKSPDVKKLMADAIKTSFTLEPEDVGKERKVDDFYQNMNRQLKALMTLLEDGKQGNTGLYRATESLRQNLDFMQQLNQFCDYVQFPLKLSNQEAHGELYVYSRKKNLAQKEGPISALLHLDMRSLGPLDVYVTMEEKKVNTNFYVADDSVLDFLEEHMELLTARLQKRGYTLNIRCSLKETADREQGAMTPFLNPGMDTSKQTVISRYAFDVRA